jgi:lysophospholipase L1-like esterase
MRLPLILLACSAFGLAQPMPKAASAADTGRHWVATWGTAQTLLQPAVRATQNAAAPVQPAPPAPPAQTQAARAVPQRRFPIPPRPSALNNQTVRMIVRTSIGGSTIRVRLSNAFGGAAVAIGAAHIARSTEGSAILPSSGRTLTFGGKPGATMYAGQMLVSDPVSLDLPPQSDVAVSLYFPSDTGVPTNHLFGLRTTYISKEGDSTGQREIGGAETSHQSYYWLAGIDVLAPASAGALVTFGDSITDGDQSTPNALGMWPALLAARLQADSQTAQVAVVNAGISGNRILGDNGGGLARLLRDALSQPGVKWLALMEGINDITGATTGTRPAGSAPALTADDLIAAYRQVIATAHLYGVRAIGCTLTPYGGSTPWRAEGEAIRGAVNQWIRGSGEFDAVVDFDAVTRDARDPLRFRAEADSPDMLHPGDAGYKLMAAAVDLAIFKSPPAKVSSKR